MNGEFAAGVERLTADDHHLASIVRRHGMPRVFRRPPTFGSLVLIILEQQVSLDSAAATFRKLEQMVDMVPERVLELDDEALTRAGFSRQKMHYVRSLAAAVTSGNVTPETLRTRTDDEVRDSLLALPGIGPWSADVFLLSCLGRSDVWPTGDRALQVGTAEVLGLRAPPSAAELEVLGERWRPLRSIAAQLIWHRYLSVRGRTG